MGPRADEQLGQPLPRGATWSRRGLGGAEQHGRCAQPREAQNSICRNAQHPPPSSPSPQPAAPSTHPTLSPLAPCIAFLQHRRGEEDGAAGCGDLVAGAMELQPAGSWLRAWRQSGGTGRGPAGSPMPHPCTALPSRGPWDVATTGGSKTLRSFSGCPACSHHTERTRVCHAVPMPEPCSGPAARRAAALPSCLPLPVRPAPAPAMCSFAVTNSLFCFTLYFFKDRALNSHGSESLWSPAEIRLPVHHRRAWCWALPARASRGAPPAPPAVLGAISPAAGS